MERRYFRSFIVLFISLLLIYFLNTCYIFAAWTLDKEAVSYREKGYEAQENGNIDSAISWYQKAVNLDPDYAVPHNDLGILFEAKGWLERAEAEYQLAVAIDPCYEKAHTNLALLYERKGELEKAAYHWMRRYRLGDASSPWREEARQRLEKLGLLDEDALGPRKKTIEKESLLKASPEKVQLEKKEWLGEKVYKKKQLKEEEREGKALTQEKLREENRKKRIEEKRLKEEKRKRRLLEQEMIKEEKRKRLLEQNRLKEEERKKLLEESRLERQKTSKAKKIKTEKKKEIKQEEWFKIRPLKNTKEPKMELAKKNGFSREGTLDDQLEESLRMAEERLLSQRREKKFIEKSKRASDTELQESLRLAEERLGGEKKKEKSPDMRIRKEGTSRDSSGKRYYLEANGYYKKGEYSRALDTIRSAKKDFPEESSLLELEQSIKNKMKEERIKDHYSEGIMSYRQKDFSDARKEFEAILNILPE